MEGDGLQIFIYLLVIIASIVGGIVKNSAKKKEEQQRRARQAEAKKRMSTEVQESVPESSSNPFEEFLRRQLEEFEEEPFTEDTMVEEPAATVVESVANKKEKHIEGNAVFNSTDQALLSDNMKEEGFSISDSIEEIENDGEVYNFSYDKISEDEITDEKDEEEFFNARKALIYSEIFKRPEY